MHPLWTAASCCPRGAAADCYRWGHVASGPDIGSVALESAVMCRHLCQTQLDCAAWTYAAKVPEMGDLGGTCFLKASGTLSAAGNPFVVSGERLCEHFGEGLALNRAEQRVGLQGVPWRTSHDRSLALAVAAAGWIVHASAGNADWHVEAAHIFSELGFVAILGALAADQVAALRRTAEQVAERVLAMDPFRLGNRGPRRYSFGAVSKTHHLMHLPGWPQLLDNAPVTAVLRHIYPDGYLAAGGGGDFVLEGAPTYQSLHLDIGGGPIYDEGPPPGVAVNYVLDELTCDDAPTRVWPGTHRVLAVPPVLPAEPKEYKEGTLLCPLPAGAAIVRDLRAWHGGTPNLSDKTRYLPNAEFVSRMWGSLTCGMGVILDPCSPVLPKVEHEKLSPHGQAISLGIVDDSGALEAAARSGGWMLTDPPPIDFTRHSPEAY